MQPSHEKSSTLLHATHTSIDPYTAELTSIDFCVPAPRRPEHGTPEQEDCSSSCCPLFSSVLGYADGAVRYFPQAETPFDDDKKLSLISRTATLTLGASTTGDLPTDTASTRVPGGDHDVESYWNPEISALRFFQGATNLVAAGRCDGFCDVYLLTKTARNSEQPVATTSTRERPGESRLLKSFRACTVSPQGDGVTSVSAVADGQSFLVATGSARGEISVWDMASTTSENLLLHDPVAHPRFSGVSALDFSLRDTIFFLLSGGSDSVVKLYRRSVRSEYYSDEKDAHGIVTLADYSTAALPLRGVCVEKFGQQHALATSAKTVMLWDLQRQQISRTFSIGAGGKNAGPRGRSLCGAAQFDVTGLWEAAVPFSESPHRLSSPQKTPCKNEKLLEFADTSASSACSSNSLPGPRPERLLPYEEDADISFSSGMLAQEAGLENTVPPDVGLLSSLWRPMEHNGGVREPSLVIAGGEEFVVMFDARKKGHVWHRRLPGITVVNVALLGGEVFAQTRSDLQFCFDWRK